MENEAAKLFNNQEYEKAINKCNEILNKNPDNIDALNILGLISNIYNKHQKAIEYFDKVLSIDIQNITALNSKGVALANLGRYQEVIETCDKALEINANNVDALNNKAAALANLGMYHQAIKYYDKALEIAPKNIDIDALNNKAIALINLGKYGEAIKLCDKGLEISSDNITLLICMAIALAELSRYETAIEYCGKALSIEPQNLLALNNKAIILGKLDKHEQTIEVCNEILEIKSENITALNTKAIALAKLGRCRYEEAIEVCNKTLQIYADNELAVLVKIELSIQSNKHTDKLLIEQITNSNISLLEIVANLHTYTNIDEIYNNLTKLLKSLLDAKKDKIYNDAIKNIDPNKENLSSYKSIYIDSLLLVALLRVDMQKVSGKKSDGTPKRAENDVAHYTRKCVAESMLFQNSKEKEDTCTAFRLSSIVKANDPEEGNTLFSFLGIDSCSKEMQEEETRACFIGCFTFNHSSLNQFRLYGKEDNREATGVSLVLKRDFFAADMQEGVMAQYSAKDFTTTDMTQGVMTTSSKLQSTQNTQEEQVSKAKEEDKKYPLFRCVYVDPKTGKVISVGHREEYTFYRESSAKWTNEEIIEYKKETEELLVIIKEGFESLKQEIQQLKTEDDKKIVYKLLIQLRYLVKHMAFKEEQECRIIRIEELYNNNKIQLIDEKPMYIHYLPIYNSIKRVYFAPQANDYKLFAHRAMKDYGESIKCRLCDHPFSC